MDTAACDFKINGQDRYTKKREAGISPVRSDGSLCSIQTDICATEAEKFAADFMGCPFNSDVTVKGDGGFDFVLPLTVEAVWLGFYKGTTRPRSSGHLIVNPYEPQRWADIYVVVAGPFPEYKMVGWCTHTKLTSYPLKDLGYGKKFAMHTNDLRGVHELLYLCSVSKKK